MLRILSPSPLPAQQREIFPLRTRYIHNSFNTDTQHNIQKDLRYCVFRNIDVKLSSPRTKLTLDL